MTALAPVALGAMLSVRDFTFDEGAPKPDKTIPEPPSPASSR